MKRSGRSAGPPRTPAAGMTLIELMVAMTIGSFLTIGAVTVFTQGRTAFRVNESVSRLQESARLALASLEPDVRMASYFGLTTRAGRIANRATPAQPIPPGLAVRNDCGQNWTIDLDAAWRGPATVSDGRGARLSGRPNLAPIPWWYGARAKRRSPRKTCVRVPCMCNRRASETA